MNDSRRSACNVPCQVAIMADSLSVTLLLISLPVAPRLGPFFFNHSSIRAAFFFNRSICCCRLPPSPPPPSFFDPLPSRLSVSRCSASNCLTFFSSFCFVRSKSPIVPLHCFEAFEEILLHPRQKASLQAGPPPHRPTEYPETGARSHPSWRKQRRQSYYDPASAHRPGP